MGCVKSKNDPLNPAPDAKPGDKKDDPKNGKPKGEANPEENKKSKYDDIFDEINDIKEWQIKAEMLLSENTGKPKDIYETVENIAQTNCGLIKKVKHKVSGMIRAQKIIKKELLEMKEEESGLFKEIALLRSLDHPNIIKLYEFFRDERCYYLLCEFCEHGELYDKIKEKRGFDEFTTAHLMKQLLSVVYYCHSNSIINRDLRPENILIESEETTMFDGNETVLYNIRVSDFKSARTFKTSKKLNKKVGNPYYIAPEVLKRKYNEKCDLWSCGIIMYVLLTGKPPFAGSTDKEVLEKVETGTFEFFEKDMQKFSNECKQLLKDLTKYDPGKRPTAGEALKHKWFKGVNQLKQNTINQGALLTSFNNLTNFSPEFRFQQATFAYMIHHLTEQEEIKEIRKIFEAFDTNNDGKLSHEEVLDGFKLMIKNFNKSEKDLTKALKKIDQDKSGTIEYEEFIRASIDKRKFITEERIRTVFNLFKNPKSDCITPSELKTILGLASKQFSSKIWNDIIMEIFKECDENKDNEINLDEFNTMMNKLVI